jgi:hypothetical protein
MMDAPMNSILPNALRNRNGEATTRKMTMKGRSDYES